jgi:hypothetical protein
LIDDQNVAPMAAEILFLIETLEKRDRNPAGASCRQRAGVVSRGGW